MPSSNDVAYYIVMTKFRSK